MYAAVRSFDGEDNASAVSNTAHVYIPGLILEGRCVDAMTKNELEGLHVQLTERNVHTLATDARGRYQFVELAAGLAHLSIRGNSPSTVYHNYSYDFNLKDDVSLVQHMVEYVPTELPLGANVLSLLSRALSIIE